MYRYTAILSIFVLGLIIPLPTYTWIITICNSNSKTYDVRLGWAAWGSDTVITVDGMGKGKTYDSGGYCVNKVEVKPHGTSNYRSVSFPKTGAGMSCQDITIRIGPDGNVSTSHGTGLC